jgi:LCP family protein required for cell wall assembly
MADASTRTDLAQGDGPPGAAPRKPARRRRGLRIVLISLGSLVVLLGAVAVGGYVFVNHLAGRVHRTPVTFHKVAGPSIPGETVLITGAGDGSAGSSGLIMLLHLDVGGKTGGVVSIPPQTMVQVPGHGQTQVVRALAFGGPSLLVQAVQQVTGVQIDHYARIDFTHAASLINAVGGVPVTLPETTKSDGYTFHAGVNQLNAVTAAYYVRQSSLSEDGRVLRQESLLRAVMQKMADGHLLTLPETMYRVTNPLIAMLTVDSNFTNSQLETLATKLRSLGSGAGTFLTAPTQTEGKDVSFSSPEASQLWTAVKQGQMAAFAQRYPTAVTPTAVP